MIEKRLKQLWEPLRGKKPHLPHFLDEIQLQGLRGIDDLRLKFDYPVSVLAGGNASGKSTALFATACAYRVPGARARDFVPSTLFPDYRPGVGQRSDEARKISINFEYSTPEGHRSMRWLHSTGWKRRFVGCENAVQPERRLYLRTLSNLSRPSEVRGILSMSRMKSALKETPLTASQIEFAQQMLPFRYSEFVNLSNGKKDMLFATQERGVAYSELHMSAGERAVLHLVREIAQIDGALVLIDEVEAGLHPWVQQLLMLQLQDVALRRNLQIIVTTHSPVVLDAVPSNGRIFLDRDQETGRVTVRPAYRDVVQNALYGRSSNVLNLLCEDDAAEGVLRGIFDVLLPQENIRPESVRIGRDTGAEQFPMHATAFRKFGQIQNFVFLLDGDKRASDVQSRSHEESQTKVPVLFLPGQSAPEVWIWDRLQQRPDRMAREISLAAADLKERTGRLDAIYDSAADKPGTIAKAKLGGLANALGRAAPEICRLVARAEVEEEKSEIQPLVEALQRVLAQRRAE